MELPSNWFEQLEALRREQKPRYQEQPSLQLPLPPREPPPGWEPDEDPENESPRVVIIEL